MGDAYDELTAMLRAEAAARDEDEAALAELEAEEAAAPPPGRRSREQGAPVRALSFVPTTDVSLGDLAAGPAAAAGRDEDEAMAAAIAAAEAPGASQGRLSPPPRRRPAGGALAAARAKRAAAEALRAGGRGSAEKRQRLPAAAAAPRRAEDARAEAEAARAASLRRTHVFSRVPAAGEYHGVTLEDGDRRFVTVEEEEDYEERIAAVERRARASQRQILAGGESVRDMLRAIEFDDRQRAMLGELGSGENEDLTLEVLPDDTPEERARKEFELASRKERRVLEERQEREAEAVAAAAAATAAGKAKKRRKKKKGKKRGRRGAGSLWVDRYAPRTYLDLLSDEKINRSVLAWVKEWDEVVFGRKHVVPGAGPEPADGGGLFGGGGAAAGGRPAAAKKAGPHRPERKVILLAGPPGLGKTTLAHIVAVTAGYRPVEINASDDRQAQVLADKVRAAVEMRPVFGDARPNLLVIDEIDGAMGGGGGNGAINALLRVIGEGPGGGAPGGEGGGKKRKQQQQLNRPIICICNDQYAPALRPLRRVAEVHVFTPPSRERLVQRLQFVCRTESLRADAHALSALCELLENDIRSCVNALQFVGARSDHFTADMLHTLALGHKDVARDRMDVCRSVFSSRQRQKSVALQRKEAARRARNGGPAEHAAAVDPRSGDVRLVLGGILSYGNHEKVLEGVQDNYLLVRYADPTFARTVEASEWLSFCDTMLSRVRAEQDYAFGAYVPHAVVGVHLLCRTPRETRLRMPKAGFVARRALTRATNILRSFLSPESSLGKQGMTTRTAAVDVVSHALDVLAPSLRAVNFQLLNAREKDDMHRLVDTLVHLRVTFEPEAGNMDPRFSMPVYRLDPRLDLLVDFNKVRRGELEGMPDWLLAMQPKEVPTKLPARRNLPPQLMEMLRREVQYETVRRHARHLKALEAEARKRGVPPAALASAGSSAAASGGGPAASQASQAPSPSQSLGKAELRKSLASMLSPAAQKQKRAGEPSPSPASKRIKGTFLSDIRARKEKSRSQTRVTPPVRYKFQEGFTNAVRRTVHVRDFLRPPSGK